MKCCDKYANPNNMDAPGGPQCHCGKPSIFLSGMCLDCSAVLEDEHFKRALAQIPRFDVKQKLRNMGFMPRYIEWHGKHQVGAYHESNPYKYGCNTEMVASEALAWQEIIPLAEKVLKRFQEDNPEKRNKEMANSKPEDIAKKFLRYSFNDISDKYEGLTKEEKALCTKEEFEELIKWMNQKEG